MLLLAWLTHLVVCPLLLCPFSALFLLQAGDASSSDDEGDEAMEAEGGSDFELELSGDEGRPKKKGKKGAAAKVRTTYEEQTGLCWLLLLLYAGHAASRSATMGETPQGC